MDMHVEFHGEITIDIKGLEELLAQFEALRKKYEEKIEGLQEKLKKIYDADNWSFLREQCEGLIKVYEREKEKVTKRIEEIKKEITTIIESVQQKQIDVRNKFGQLLIDYGDKIMKDAESDMERINPTPATSPDSEPTVPAAEPEVPTAEPEVPAAEPSTPATPTRNVSIKEAAEKVRSDLRQKIDEITNKIKSNNDSLRERINNSPLNIFNNNGESILGKFFNRK